MLTATLTIPALGIRTRAAFLLGLSAEPSLSLSQPGDGSAVFTLADTTAEAAEQLQRLLAGQYGTVKLDLVEVAQVVEETAEAPAEPDLDTEAALFAVEVEAVLKAAAVEPVAVEEVAVETPEVVTTEEIVTEPVVVRLSMATPRVLVEQGQALLRSMPADSFTVCKPATGWKGTVWCINFASVDRSALDAALAGLACAASVWAGEDMVASNAGSVTPTGDTFVYMPVEVAVAVEPPVEEEIVLPPSNRVRPSRAERRAHR